MLVRTIAGIVLFIFLGFSETNAQPASPDSATAKIYLNFGGDLTFANHFQTHVKNRYTYPFARFPEFANADITMANLETVLSDSGNPRPKLFNFRAAPEYVQVLKNGGIDIVTVANNHIYDYGPEGLVETLHHLDQAGIAYVGAGTNRAQAHRPEVFTVRGLQLGFLAYYGLRPHSGSHPATANSAGTALRSLKRIRSDIKALRDSVDLVIVNFHWGLEKEHIPQEEQIFFAHKTIDYGADLIIGHHPHVLQGIERYRDRFIVYSLGNFIFGGNSRTYEQTAVFRAEINVPQKKISGFQILPVEVHYWQPQLLKGPDGSAVVDSLKKYSEALPATAF